MHVLSGCIDVVDVDTNMNPINCTSFNFMCVSVCSIFYATLLLGFRIFTAKKNRIKLNNPTSTS